MFEALHWKAYGRLGTLIRRLVLRAYLLASRSGGHGGIRGAYKYHNRVNPLLPIDSAYSIYRRWHPLAVVRRSFSFAFVILSGATLLPAATAGIPRTVASPNPSPRPSISVAVSPAAINQGNDSVFTISTSTVNPLQATPIRFSMSGTAQPSVDYTMAGAYGWVNIPPNAALIFELELLKIN